MSEEAANHAVQPAAPGAAPAAEYFAVWSGSLALVLEQIVGKPVPMEAVAEAAPGAPEAAASDHFLMVTASGSLRGEMSLRTPQCVLLAVAQQFLGETADAAAEFRSEHQEAWEEFFRQVAGHAASGLKPRFGDVQLRVEAAAPPSWPAAASGWLTSAESAPCRLWVCGQLSAALHASLASQPAASAAPDNSQKAGEPVSAPVAASGANLDLLRDVELEVVLRFGECRMALREILELGAGSVVELDRGVEEPVDLLLDGKLIARGEVVVVEGNYGLRVREVACSPSDLTPGRVTA